ncbi:MAG: DUF790 family protein [SAR324 cluster bacterium]|nr:DUF790 family protein [SAR324 cluster bacterium]
MLGGQYQMATYRGGKVFPKKLGQTEENLTLAQELIYVFELNQDQSKEQLKEDLKGVDSLGFHPKLVQGIAKLLIDKSDFTSLSTEDMPDLRTGVFDASADYWKKEGQKKGSNFLEHQRLILKDHDLSPNVEVKRWLYSDLESNQIMVKTPKFTPKELLELYNLEQVKSLFLNAVSLRLTLELESDTSLRQVLQNLKFFGLLFEICHQSKLKLVLEVEGPQSVLDNGRSYGVEMANFFPSLLLLKCPWELDARLKRKGVDRIFAFLINQKNPYQSSYKEQGVWIQKKLKALEERFTEKYSKPFSARLTQEIIPLKKGAFLTPDLEIKKSKKTAQVELIRYLSEPKKKWLAQVVKELPKNYYFAIKAKGKVKEELQVILGEHFLPFATELTAPALKKLVE